MGLRQTRKPASSPRMTGARQPPIFRAPSRSSAARQRPEHVRTRGRVFMRIKLGVFVMAFGMVANVAYGQLERGDRYSGAQCATRSPVLAQHGMAATAQPLATQVANDILKKGGSEVDAAIAANATLGLVEPV